jgi:hypothetical protein
MKTHIVLGMVLVLFAFGCGSSGGGDNPGPNPIPEPQGVMNLRTSSGTQSVPFSYVTSVDVQIFNAPPDVGVDIEKRFMGDKAVGVIAQLGFAVPQSVNTDNMMWSGAVFLNYLDPTTAVEQSKTFNIFDTKVMNDSDFPKVTYTAEPSLNHAWLASQQN